MISDSRVSLASLTPNNIGTCRKLNSILFPVKYSENFYKQILEQDVEDFCKLIYYNDIPVGTICCRFDTESKENELKLYLMTMGILAPYRSRRLGSQCIEQVLEAAGNMKPKIHKIYLHVQVSNCDAKRFYERHGFKVIGTHPNYYKRISPHDAWILQKDLEL